MKTEWLRRIVPKLLTTLVLLSSIILPIVGDVRQAHADAVDLYWFNGTGNWSDAAHWGTASNGVGAPHAAPTATNSVFFDLNSFTAAGQTVTVDVDANMANMDWTGVTNTPTLAGAAARDFNIYGNGTFVAGMTHTFTGVIRCVATSGAHTFTAGGVLTENFKNYCDASASYVLQDNLNVGTQYVRIHAGQLDTNNKTVTCGDFNTNNAETRQLQLRGSIINCTSVTMLSTVLTFAANTSTINCSGNFSGGGLTAYNIVNLTGAASTITGSNTFNVLALPPGTTDTITFTDGTTQTATTFALTGSLGHVHTLQGSGVGGWNLSQAAGVVNADYISISRSTAGGGATFNGNGVSINGGNNVGWNFPQTVSTQAATTTANTYTVNGTLTDLGGDPAGTTVFFQYGNTPGLGNTTAPVAQTTASTFSATLTIPTDSGGVYYRSGTTSGGGTSYGTTLYLSTPSGVGGALLKGVLRVVAAGIILAGALLSGGKGGMAVLVKVAVGLVAFAIIDSFINMI